VTSALDEACSNLQSKAVESTSLMWTHWNRLHQRAAAACAATLLLDKKSCFKYIYWISWLLSQYLQ
jgi:hypothetical protein